MMIHRRGFNIILLGLGLLSAWTGCSTAPKPQKVDCSLRVHLEVNRDGTERSKPVPIYRSNPVLINAETAPFVTEVLIKEAKVTDTIGGFALEIRFDRRGSLLLEQYTSSNRGKHLAIFCQWTRPEDKKNPVSRWLAAPIISERIADGVLVFTPDATREECNLIVTGLNQFSKKMAQKYKFTDGP